MRIEPDPGVDDGTAGLVRAGDDVDLDLVFARDPAVADGVGDELTEHDREAIGHVYAADVLQALDGTAHDGEGGGLSRDGKPNLVCPLSRSQQIAHAPNALVGGLPKGPTARTY